MTAASGVAPPLFLGLAGHPLRWQLLAELALSDRRVQELSDAVGRPQNLVSYHLRRLRASGLVSARQSSADRRDSYHRIYLGRYAELLAGAGPALHPALKLVLPEPQSFTKRPRERFRVLFLCTGNSARSQMAEAMLVSTCGELVEACSAGNRPKPIHPNTILVMRERGLDLSGRRSKHMSEYHAERFDLVVTLCDRVREVCPEFPGEPTRIHWSVADPAEGEGSAAESYPAFRQAAQEIAERVAFLSRWIEHVVAETEVK